MNQGLATSKRFIVVLGLLTGLVAFAIDISLPAIPMMVRELGTDMSVGQQIVGFFIAGMAIGQLPMGLVSDRVGRLPVLYLGVGLFTLAGIVSSMSQHIELMLAARFVQGIGSSAGMVLARAIVRDIASGARAARLMTVMVMVFTAAPMLAPLFGSFLVSFWGWRVPFAATAVAGLLVLYGINSSLRETHVPKNQHHVLRQFLESFREFAGHRQCIFGLLVTALIATGIMALISGSSALIIAIYGFPVKYFGFIFALSGAGVLAGSTINRHLLLRFDALQMIGIGATIIGIAGMQLLVMAWLGHAPFWWIWSNLVLFMFGAAFVTANATALALDPVPAIAGAAASILGTVQSLCGAVSAIVTSALYAGTITNVALVVGSAGTALALLYVFRRVVLGRRLPLDTGS